MRVESLSSEGLHLGLTARRVPTLAPGFLQQVLSVPDNLVRTIEDPLPLPDCLCLLWLFISQVFLPFLARPRRPIEKHENID